MNQPLNQLFSLDQINPNPFQPRQHEEPAAVREMAISIHSNRNNGQMGLLQVPAARRVNGRIELAFGHTRKAAFQLLATQGVPDAGIPADPTYNSMPLILQDLDDWSMFRDGIQENIQRHDLSAIEVAASMKFCMDHFHKTSEEVGKIYGVSAETVRGKVRLLNLAPEAQDKLASGAISEGTARTLLSMQKVAPEKMIRQTVEKIERHSQDQLPEDVIKNSLDQFRGVLCMWRNDEDGGKARSDYRGGWSLNMKNFPNQLLALPTAEEIVLALGIEDQPKKREMVDQACLLEPVPLGDALRRVFENDPRNLAKIEHILNPPGCFACPFYTKVQGSHYCGMELCHDRKTQAWHKHLIQRASENLKIGIYQPSDGKYVILGNYDRNHQQLFDKRDPGLRLLAKEQVKANYIYQSYKGVDDDIFVAVITGPAINKLKSGRGAQFTPAARLEQKKKRIYNERRRELIWVFTASGKQLFDGLNFEALENLDDWSYLSRDERPLEDVIPADEASEEIQVEYLRRLMIWKMVGRLGYRHGYSRLNSGNLADVAEILADLAKEWGFKCPKRILEMAKAGDAEIKTIKASVKKEKAA